MAETHTGELLTDDQIGRRTPVCPTCKEPLIAREPNRRFIENDTVQQCVNGHVWELKDAGIDADGDLREGEH